MSHTPGPWRVSDRYEESETVIDGDGFKIANTTALAVLNGWEDLRHPTPSHWASDDRASRERARGEAAANARLIAAAPEMYEALKVALPILCAAAEATINSEHPENVGGLTEHYSCSECDYVSHGGEEHDPEAECAPRWAALLLACAAITKATGGIR